MASISFYFNHKIVEFVGALQQNLMRYPAWNADHVPRIKLLADTALDVPCVFRGG